MKRLIVASVVLLSVALSGCQDSKDEAQPLSEKDFYKTIGEEIPVETAIKWMELYRKEKSVQGRLEGAAPDTCRMAPASAPSAMRIPSSGRRRATARQARFADGARVPRQSGHAGPAARAAGWR